MPCLIEATILCKLHAQFGDLGARACVLRLRTQRSACSTIHELLEDHPLVTSTPVVQ